MLRQITDAIVELSKLDDYLDTGWETPCINKLDEGWHVSVSHAYYVPEQKTTVVGNCVNIGWVDNPLKIHTTAPTLKQALIETFIKIDSLIVDK